MSEKKQKDTRTRNFATVVYPESAPENWQDILTERFIPAFISPLHDSDKNPTGEVKKAHYHVIIMYDSVKTLEQAKEVFDSIGGVGCEKVGSLRGYARYLCHLDNPDKAQYNIEEVRNLSGADYIGVIGLAVDKYQAIDEMLDWCVSNDVYGFGTLVLYAKRERRDWYRVLIDNSTLFMKETLKSLSWEVRQERSNT